MSKLRSINTSMWCDTWFENLNPSNKLLFIYLITNERTNMLGIYEISISKIAFETGVNKETIVKALKGFEIDGKIRYSESRIILINYLKHQKYNTNMKKSALAAYNNLPNSLKHENLEYIEYNDNLDSINKAFESLCEGFGMLRKVELEVKDKVKDKKENIPTLQEFTDYAKEHVKNIDTKALTLKYKSWKQNDWKDGNNKQIKNWKAKLLNTLQYLPTVQIEGQHIKDWDKDEELIKKLNL